MGIIDGAISTAQKAVSYAEMTLTGSGASYLESLTPADYRGVPFCVNGGELSYNHKVEVTEPQYEGGDILVRRFGSSAAVISVDAFLAGNDYLLQRDALEYELRANSRGMLKLPTRDSMDVQIVEVSSAESKRLGLAVVTFTAIDVLSLPTSADGATGQQAVIDMATDALQDLADFAADVIDVAGKPAYVLNAAINRTRARIEIAIQTVRGSIQSVKANWLALAETIKDLGDYDSTTTAAIVEAVQSVDDVEDLLEIYEPTAAPDSSAASASERAVQSNRAAIDALFSRAALYQAAILAADTNFENASDARRVRDRLVLGLLHEGASDLAVATLAAISLTDLPDVKTVTVSGIDNLLSIAAELYDDPTRAEQIHLRNPGLANPMLIGGIDLEVLSE